MVNKQGQFASGISWFATVLVIFVILAGFLIIFSLSFAKKEGFGSSSLNYSENSNYINSKLNTEFLLDHNEFQKVAYFSNREEIRNYLESFRNLYFKDQCFFLWYGEFYLDVESKSFPQSFSFGNLPGFIYSQRSQDFYFITLKTIEGERNVSISFKECKNE